MGEGTTITDYITVVRNSDGEIRLNINSYVGRRQLDRMGSNTGISVTAIHRDIFMDHHVYAFEARNTSSNSILLNNRNDARTVFLEDDRENTYTARIHEVDSSLLLLDSGTTRRFSIRFNKVHGTQREIRSVQFTNIIMDAEQYFEERNIETVPLTRVSIPL
ncbi:MAG: hypothetical protein FWC79_03065 [Oscillospiraceae bacterium]|nr:hypothetical protein [Oscillospiraceae bacterium]